MPGLLNLLVTAILVTKNIVNVEDVITIFIIVAIVLDAFARFRENSARIFGRLIFKRRIAYSVCGRQMSCKGL